MGQFDYFKLTHYQKHVSLDLGGPLHCIMLHPASLRSDPLAGIFGIGMMSRETREESTMEFQESYFFIFNFQGIDPD